ncbi:DEAD/DEAH box helicase family protein [Apilactobacillus bombintestini]|uniref:DEAD/DEAH box helicase n=1 Tax=Apilactobacillus bombintestini TaxID=2419772 RepID=A0A387ANY4_9LACO|nr:DEAD/DEAH box helicase family protein [Apilactobacillus bombintestini]AYF92384.1 DEAD/DEAH box helicase [Apilactobacillus bombintestini]
MQINYEKLNYQEKAVKAVINTLSGYDNTLNEIITDPVLLDSSVKKTLLNVNGKYPGNDYLSPFPQFNIEMETGTGKTMVYLQTIMALHKRFGENKFIIVVPSRAIKTGVQDNLRKLRNYLSDIFNTDKYQYFVYNSKKIGDLQNFEDNSFQIMLTTIQAFNKDTNIINQEYNEGFFGGRPLDQITDSNPIVIIDEPQSVDSAKAGKKAISSLNPKIVLRYSATHKEKQYPLLYEFGPVDAYKEHMVKHIETLGTEVNTDGNIPIVELSENPEIKNGKLVARVLAYKSSNDDFFKKIVTLKKGDSLAKKTHNSLYNKFGLVSEINITESFVKFENGYKAELGSLEGEFEIWVTAQMKALIRDHIDRELKMQRKGIKVLSLIFLDKVKNYRVYTNDGPKNGKYAKLFERLYTEVLHSNPKYKKLNDYNVPVSEVHDGYFAKDKATKNKPEIYRDSRGNGDTIRDESAYNVIMADKEGLLTQYVPGKSETNTKAAKLRFIFSHSALKEGWDNPNVFQILTIASPKNDLARRQKIGRGLRIPVNQNGERVYDDEQNVVTIYANETFEQFADGLQKEYAKSGLLKDKINGDFFANLVVQKNHNVNTNDYDEKNISDDNHDSFSDENQNTDITTQVSKKESKNFVNILKEENVISSDGKPIFSGIKKLSSPDTKKHFIKKAKEVGLDSQATSAMINKITIQFDVPEPRNRRNRKEVNITNKNNPYLNDLWNKIAHKVNYRVKFDEDNLINDIVNGNNPLSEIQLKKMTAIQTRARVNLKENKVDNRMLNQNTEHLVWNKLPIVNVIKQIADQSGITKNAVATIILETQKKDNSFIDKIKMNPALFQKRALNNIKGHQRKLLNKSLVYVRNGKTWSKDLLHSFSASENTLWKVPDRGLKKTLFEKIATQSEEENKFAESLVNEKKIKYFLKLPSWFKIPTPFGNYNPDWAILAERDGSERLYFIVDTKTTSEMSDLREKEQDRIRAGRQAYSKEVFNDVDFEAPVKVVGDLDI